MLAFLYRICKVNYKEFLPKQCGIYVSVKPFCNGSCSGANKQWMGAVWVSQESELLNLTVGTRTLISEMDLVHVHSKHQINLNCLPRLRSFRNLLVASSEILKNRSHRLYYVLPRFDMVLQLDDSISYDVFYDWLLYKSVNNVYEVIENLKITDFKKVVTLYVSQLPTLVKEPTNRIFKQTIAKPFSYRPMEPELDSSDVPPSNKHHEGAALYGGDEDIRAMVMSGNFNVNFASSDSAPHVTLLRDKFSLELNNDPTISTTKSGTTIDAIFTRYMDNVQLQMYVSYFSYHKPIITTIPIEQNDNQSLA